MVWSSPLALHIEIYTASRSFPVIGRLLLKNIIAQTAVWLRCWMQGSETYTFPCKRWLAKGEDDGAIERELVSDKVFEEVVRKDGTVKKKEHRRNTLLCNYTL